MNPYQTFHKQTLSILNSKDDDKTKLLKIQVAADFVKTMEEAPQPRQQVFQRQIVNQPSTTPTPLRTPQNASQGVSQPIDPLQDMPIVGPGANVQSGKKVSQRGGGGIIS